MAEIFDTGTTWPVASFVTNAPEVYVPIVSFDPNVFQALRRDTKRGQHVGLQLGIALSSAIFEQKPKVGYVEVRQTAYTAKLDELKAGIDTGEIDPTMVMRQAQHFYFLAESPEDLIE